MYVPYNVYVDKKRSEKWHVWTNNKNAIFESGKNGRSMDDNISYKMTDTSKHFARIMNCSHCTCGVCLIAKILINDHQIHSELNNKTNFIKSKNRITWWNFVLYVIPSSSQTSRLFFQILMLFLSFIWRHVMNSHQSKIDVR